MVKGKKQLMLKLLTIEFIAVVEFIPGNLSDGLDMSIGRNNESGSCELYQLF